MEWLSLFGILGGLNTEEEPTHPAIEDVGERPKPRKACVSKKVARQRERMLRVRKGERDKSAVKIIRIVEAVATLRGVNWRDMFALERGTDPVSAARVFAMAACGAAGVPIFHTSRAFGRNWATIYSAEMRCGRLYRSSKQFRAEWDGVTSADTTEKP